MGNSTEIQIDKQYLNRVSVEEWGNLISLWPTVQNSCALRSMGLNAKVYVPCGSSKTNWITGDVTASFRIIVTFPVVEYIALNVGILLWKTILNSDGLQVVVWIGVRFH